MFESYADRADARLVDEKPTEWKRIDRFGAEKPEPEPEREAQSTAQSAVQSAAQSPPQSPARGREGGIFQVLCDLVGSARRFAAEHEQLILIGVVLLVLLDGGDDIELLIALGILLYPYISELIKKLGSQGA